jgi:hypothetical protein
MLAVIVGVWYWGWYLPLQQTCAQVSLTVQSLANRNAFLIKTLQQRPLLEHQRVEFEQKLCNLATVSKIDDHDMIDILLSMLKKYDVSCKELKPLPIKYGDYWQKHSFELVFKGKFKNIKSLMNELFTGQKFVTYNNLSLVRLKKHKVKGEMKLTFITFGDYENDQEDGSL